MLATLYVRVKNASLVCLSSQTSEIPKRQNMEDKLLAEIEQIKTLLNRQGKALEELQAINQENRDDRRHLELRLVAAFRVIEALIHTHPHRKALHQLWEQRVSSGEIERMEAKAGLDIGGGLDAHKGWLPSLKRELQQWGYRMV